jgi:hypothetical protein
MVDAPREIDILKVRAKLFGKAADLTQNIGSVKRTTGAGAKDIAGLQVRPLKGLTVATFAGEAAAVVVVASAIDQGDSSGGRTLQD